MASGFEGLHLYTSSFRSIIPDGIVGVSIARYPPRTWRGPRAIALAPKLQLFREIKGGDIDFDEFSALYLESLDSRVGSVQAAMSMLSRLGEPLALLCWCDEPEFCHRRLCAAWIEREYGLKVPELE